MSGESLTTATPLALIFFYGRFHNAQHNVNVMYHEVVHYRNIGATRVELGKAVCFNKHGVVQVRDCHRKGRVKPFNVSPPGLLRLLHAIGPSVFLPHLL
jgi:molybdopterin synthase catalytic subunit